MYQLVRECGNCFEYKNKNGNMKIVVSLNEETDKAEADISLINGVHFMTGTTLSVNHLRSPLFYYEKLLEDLPERHTGMLPEIQGEREDIESLIERWTRILLLSYALDNCREEHPEYLRQICKNLNIRFLEGERRISEQQCAERLLAELLKYEEVLDLQCEETLEYKEAV